MGTKPEAQLLEQKPTVVDILTNTFTGSQLLTFYRKSVRDHHGHTAHMMGSEHQIKYGWSTTRKLFDVQNYISHNFIFIFEIARIIKRI